MGRHSRRGGPQGPSGEAAKSAGNTPGIPGTGRRRRTPGPAGDAPNDPAARGGHPEQRGTGGGRGAAGMPPGVRIPRPRAGEPGAGASGAPGDGTPPFGVPAGERGSVPGPRRAYLEAFDAPVGRDTAEAGPGPRPERPVDGDEGSAPADAERVPAGAGARGARKGHRARTLTGAAAAAVTTALAVVIAGQVAEQRQDGAGGPSPRTGDDRADGGDEASRSQARPGQDAKAADYATQMARVFPLDPQLTASGRFRPAGGDAKAPGHGKVLRYRVDVEEGLPLDGELFAEAVHKTLNDDRSWAHGGRRTFQRVGSGDADFVISLASPGTTAKWCAKSGLDTTEDNVSCDSAVTERVMINAYRWAQGAKTYGADKMLAYRQMLINHEVGHRLGHNHESCTRQGALAPVMMQQTKFLTTDGVTCRPNSWPYPTGS
ncbi:DUF3152 domain-containing protein [Streptomyces sp. WZ-12]|uniref:DUF3152 domain-containing protein n=1 Tax=Streptomyces sp. WZ-12 TaxID=3030210 RepID=UPI002380E622|nr:DUF3152 domain-containing protein [Streptomyces sp. WZ-12]